MPIEVGKTGKCPHCGVSNRFERPPDDKGNARYSFNLPDGISNTIQRLALCKCTACSKIIIFWGGKMVCPLGSSRPPCPEEVPEQIANDYKEACLVEPLSKKAAAALARRCLQHILYDQGFKKRDLNDEIDAVMPTLPSHLSEAIDAIRRIGNFATHPIKYKNTGEIVEVEDGEAEWVLDVIKELFDHFYVAPLRLKAMRETLNKKLEDSGKSLLKSNNSKLTKAGEDLLRKS